MVRETEVNEWQVPGQPVSKPTREGGQERHRVYVQVVDNGPPKDKGLEEKEGDSVPLSDPPYSNRVKPLISFQTEVNDYLRLHVVIASRPSAPYPDHV